ncbi:ArsI/CadI family heavy metal resistance metalloenzyme [Almyronema epifaneia]|uniref:ArsI/CadI family heavy metal resistance metalloenzyme n=1 Tax=Almyronema epifaneia S1 TaxID=2991925 RepID=A0ABW6IKW6_9CYAN
MTGCKTHIALQVADLNRSLAFYQVLLDAYPVKHKADYVKFDVADPGLNLTLNASGEIHPSGALSHLGIQVDSAQALQMAIARFRAAGLAMVEERDTDCCYALQDKVWVSDPDGNRWEIFVVKVADTAPEKTVGVTKAVSQQPTTCCP